MNEEEAEESFVMIGTPFPDIDDDDLTFKKPAAQHNQVVKNEKNKRVFHGAFSGGFSAGYFNTVGTLEGWTPTIFKSSRSERMKLEKCHMPEDFMDDDDFSEYGIAPKKVKPKEKFKSQPNILKEVFEEDIGAFDTELLFANVLSTQKNQQPKISAIGIRLLKKLGWKNLSELNDLKTESIKDSGAIKPKVYGCALPEKLTKKKLLTDQVWDDLDFTKKTNTHGLGYRGITQSSMDFISERKSFAGVHGQAFGVGAMEEEDEDIYSQDSMINYDRVLIPEDSKSTLHGWTAPKFSKDTDLKSNASALDCFELYTEPILTAKVYKAPVIPKDFNRYHNKIISVSNKTNNKNKYSDGTDNINNNNNNISNDDDKTINNNNKDITGYRKFQKQDYNSRGVILGEKANIDSVFDLISEEDKFKLEAIKRSFLDNNPQIKNDLPKPLKEEREKLIEWEARDKTQDNSKFSKSTFLTDKFTTVHYYNQGQDIMEPIKDVESEKDQAVRLKMFGILTRQTVKWHPDKYLCKRFNIADPYPDSSNVGLAESKTKYNNISSFTDVKTMDNLQPIKQTSHNLKSGKNIKPLEILKSVDLSFSDTNSGKLNLIMSDIEMDKNRNNSDKLEVKYMIEDSSSLKTATTQQSNLSPSDVSVLNKEKVSLFKSIFEDDLESSNSESENEKTEITSIASNNTNSITPISYLSSKPNADILLNNSSPLPSIATSKLESNLKDDSENITSNNTCVMAYKNNGYPHENNSIYKLNFCDQKESLQTKEQFLLKEPNLLSYLPDSIKSFENIDLRIKNDHRIGFTDSSYSQSESLQCNSKKKSSKSLKEKSSKKKHKKHKEKKHHKDKKKKSKHHHKRKERE